MFGEELLSNFSTIFVIHVPDVGACERVVEVNYIHTKGQDFEVCIINFFSFVLFSFSFANVFMEFPV